MNNEFSNSPKDKYNPKNYAPLPAKYYEQVEYERSLVSLLEKIKIAALGNDYQSKLELKNLEKRVISKLIETELEIKKIVAALAKDHTDLSQGKLF